MTSNVPKRLMKKKPSSGSVSIMAAREKKQLKSESPTPRIVLPRETTLKSSKQKVSKIRRGDFVECTWPSNPAYGNSEMSFTGCVTAIDDWITVVNKLDVVLHLPLSMLTVRKINGTD